jgi:hypothetical protein
MCTYICGVVGCCVLSGIQINFCLQNTSVCVCYAKKLECVNYVPEFVSFVGTFLKKLFTVQEVSTAMAELVQSRERKKIAFFQPAFQLSIFDTRGRCYDHNFLRFLTISAKKLAFFSKTNVLIKILHILALFWVKHAKFFAEFFGENILKIITSVPGANPTTLIYNTSNVKIYYATNSIACFENKKYFPYFKNSPAY